MSYEISAPIYDAIYESIKAYPAEAVIVRRLIEKAHPHHGHTLFDVAGGTGLHTAELAPFFNITLVDLSPAQLSVAAKRMAARDLHAVQLVEGDMRNFVLTHQADAVICLFSAIGHLTSVAELHQTIANFAMHTKRGGVILIEPWLMPHMWLPGYIGFDVVDTPELKIARMSRSIRKGNLIHLELEHLVARPAYTEHFVETHDLMMFSEAEFEAAFAAAGLVSEYDPRGINASGRGVFIATKPDVQFTARSH